MNWEAFLITLFVLAGIAFFCLGVGKRYIPGWLTLAILCFAFAAAIGVPQ